MSKSRGHHRHEEHEEHEEHVNHEAWVIPYADMLTLLMALFLVLFAVGGTDLEKFKKLAASFREEFGNGSAEVVDLGGTGEGASGDGGAGVMPADVTPTVVVTTTLSPAEEALGEKEAAQSAAEDEADSLDEVRESVQAAADAVGLGTSLNFTLDARGLVVTIVTDQVLFQAGDASLQPEGLTILDVVGQALLKVPNNVSIEGHTDDRPISNSRFPSNWELSNARATSVVRYFIDRVGIPANRMSATGWADQRPIADNATPQGAAANRRVEVIVTAAVSLDPIVGEDGTVDPDAPADPPADAAPAISTPASTPSDGTTSAGGTTPGGSTGGTPTAQGEDGGEVASQAPVADVEAITGTTAPNIDPGVVPDLSPGLQPAGAGGAEDEDDGQ